MGFLKKILRAFWRAVVDTVYHDGLELAGYLAFLGLLSFFPFLVFMVALAGAIGQTGLGQRFVELIHDNLPADLIVAITPRIDEIISGPPQGLMTLAIAGAIWTSSSAVEGLRTVLNRAYRVNTPPSYFFRRLLSIAQLIVFTGITVLGMLALAFTPVILETLYGYLDLPTPDMQRLAWFRYGLTGLILWYVVSATYRVVPNTRHGWSETIPGALLVVILWLLAVGSLVGYVRHFDQVNLIYGSLAGIISVLLLFYVCGVIFILGAEFNHQLSEAFGRENNDEEAAESGPSFYGYTVLATDWNTKEMNSFRIRFLKTLLFFIPRTNPDHEPLYPHVAKWLLEVTHTGKPSREIAFDNENNVLFCSPNEKNYGFWTDNNKTFKKSELEPVDKDAFESFWEKAAGV